MKSIELFAGIGGISLAAEWAGIETVAFCEREPFCQEILSKHWSDVPIFDDVKTLNKQTLIDGGVDVGTIDIISGGYPCQGESEAGKRLANKDERWLWPEMFRIVKELKPCWVIGENVAGHVNRGLRTVTNDLENEGYETQTFVISASSVGANHERKRVFVVGYSDSKSELQKSDRQRHPKNGKHGKVLPGSIGEHFPQHIGKQINPQFVEWMMGFPEGWTKVD